MEISSATEFKNKPDGWETTSKSHDGNIWEMSQREEDILVQEFERRIAYSKFQVCHLLTVNCNLLEAPSPGKKKLLPGESKQFSASDID